MMPKRRSEAARPAVLSDAATQAIASFRSRVVTNHSGMSAVDFAQYKRRLTTMATAIGCYERSSQKFMPTSYISKKMAIDGMQVAYPYSARAAAARARRRPPPPPAAAARRLIRDHTTRARRRSSISPTVRC